MSLDRRGWERLQYPAGELKPSLVADVATGEIVDCSERGVRVVYSNEPPRLGAELHGRVCFPSGAAIEIEGVIVRVDHGEVAVQFSGLWIPPEMIQDERRRLHIAPGQDAGELWANGGG